MLFRYSRDQRHHSAKFPCCPCPSFALCLTGNSQGSVLAGYCRVEMKALCFQLPLWAVFNAKVTHASVTRLVQGPAVRAVLEVQALGQFSSVADRVLVCLQGLLKDKWSIPL